MARHTALICLAAGTLGVAAVSCSTSDTAGSGGATTTTAAEWQTSEVAVAGTTVSVQCLGSGSPTVWLVSDIGTTGADGWGDTDVPSALADRARVCTYDRPGLGASGPASSPRTVEQQADELAAVIEASGEPTPAVVVGQGYGTFPVRLLSQRALPLVAGMVLVDPVLWTGDTRPPAGASEGVVAEYAGLEQVNADLGGYGGAALPPPPAPTVVLGASHLLPARPDAATTGSTLDAADLEPPEEERHARQQGLANKSPFGEFRLVAEAGSSIQHWDAAAVVAAIEAVLDSPDLKR